jgi:hypothetical protein
MYVIEIPEFSLDEKNPYVVSNMNARIESYLKRAEDLKKVVDGMIQIFFK